MTRKKPSAPRTVRTKRGSAIIWRDEVELSTERNSGQTGSLMVGAEDAPRHESPYVYVVASNGSVDGTGSYRFTPTEAREAARRLVLAARWVEAVAKKRGGPRRV